MARFDELMPMPRLRYKGKRVTSANARGDLFEANEREEQLLADPQEVTKVSIDWSTGLIRFTVKKRPDACHYYSVKSYADRKPQTEVLAVKFEDFGDELEFIKKDEWIDDGTQFWER